MAAAEEEARLALQEKAAQDNRNAEEAQQADRMIAGLQQVTREQKTVFDAELEVLRAELYVTQEALDKASRPRESGVEDRSAVLERRLAHAEQQLSSALLCVEMQKKQIQELQQAPSPRSSDAASWNSVPARAAAAVGVQLPVTSPATSFHSGPVPLLALPVRQAPPPLIVAGPPGPPAGPLMLPGPPPGPLIVAGPPPGPLMLPGPPPGPPGPPSSQGSSAVAEAAAAHGAPHPHAADQAPAHACGRSSLPRGGGRDSARCAQEADAAARARRATAPPQSLVGAPPQLFAAPEPAPVASMPWSARGRARSPPPLLQPAFHAPPPRQRRLRADERTQGMTSTHTHTKIIAKQLKQFGSGQMQSSRLAGSGPVFPSRSRFAQGREENTQQIITTSKY